MFQFSQYKFHTQDAFILGIPVAFAQDTNNACEIAAAEDAAAKEVENVRAKIVAEKEAEASVLGEDDNDFAADSEEDKMSVASEIIILSSETTADTVTIVSEEEEEEEPVFVDVSKVSSGI